MLPIGTGYRFQLLLKGTKVRQPLKPNTQGEHAEDALMTELDH